VRRRDRPALDEVSLDVGGGPAFIVDRDLDGEPAAANCSAVRLMIAVFGSRSREWGMYQDPRPGSTASRWP
jgi:hypothetical protein